MGKRTGDIVTVIATIIMAIVPFVSWGKYGWVAWNWEVFGSTGLAPLILIALFVPPFINALMGRDSLGVVFPLAAFGLMLYWSYDSYDGINFSTPDYAASLAMLLLFVGTIVKNGQSKKKPDEEQEDNK